MTDGHHPLGMGYDGLEGGDGTDGNAPLAIAVGMLAAAVAGAAWALLVNLTGYEIGYAAWGIGLLVGFAMAKVTRDRNGRLAVTGAGLAFAGLVIGKALIFLTSAGLIATELADDQELLTGAIAWSMYDDRELSPATLEELDATIAAGDTLSDAVWETMLEEADARVSGMTAAERDELARATARTALAHIGIVNGIILQTSLFDLLWLFLAVGTAYGMMSPAREEEVDPVPSDGDPNTGVT